MDYSTTERGRRDVTIPAPDGVAPAPRDERLGAHGSYRGSRREAVKVLGERAGGPELPLSESAIAIDVVAPSVIDAPVGATMSRGDAIARGDALPRGDAMARADLDALVEPVFTRNGWVSPPSQALAEHPLVRGLMLELPPRGRAPEPDWLERWFDAARAILTLLYAEPGASGR